jgi:PAS domain-containing protein
VAPYVITSVNKAFTNLTGVDPKQVVGQPFSDLIHSREAVAKILLFNAAMRDSSCSITSFDGLVLRFACSGTNSKSDQEGAMKLLVKVYTMNPHSTNNSNHTIELFPPSSTFNLVASIIG